MTTMDLQTERAGLARAQRYGAAYLAECAAVEERQRTERERMARAWRAAPVTTGARLSAERITTRNGRERRTVESY